MMVSQSTSSDRGRTSAARPPRWWSLCGSTSPGHKDSPSCPSVRLCGHRSPTPTSSSVSAVNSSAKPQLAINPEANRSEGRSQQSPGAPSQVDCAGNDCNGAISTACPGRLGWRLSATLRTILRRRTFQVAATRRSDHRGLGNERPPSRRPLQSLRVRPARRCSERHRLRSRDSELYSPASYARATAGPLADCPFFDRSEPLLCGASVGAVGRAVEPSALDPGVYDPRVLTGRKVRPRAKAAWE
jgi:hypothetical protein